MSDKSFVLVSLKDSKSKNLTKVLSNDTSRKILDYLSKKESATETEISKNLNLPLSTVHYNVKQLADSKLLSQDEFHYSDKGKEVIHYKLANKFIIISQEEDSSIIDKLKSFLPVAIIFTAISGLMATYEFLTSKILDSGVEGALFMAKAADSVARNAQPELLKLANSGAETIPAVSSSNPFNASFWFFLGGIFFLIVLLLMDFTKKKIKNKV